MPNLSGSYPSSIAKRSFSSARFSMRDTSRRAYWKRYSLRKRLRLTEAKLKDELFFLGQIHPLDEADQ